MSNPLDSLKAALEGRYDIEGVLGEGGMATVYLANDRKHHRQVAIKILKSELTASLGPERFLREVRLTAGLDHPHIVPLLDSGAAGGFLYYVMPFVEGESLRDRLDREKQLPLDDALRISHQVADALDYAHGQGVIHRDVKPENILLSAGHARVSDFGIARAVTAAGDEALTGTGMAIGTPTYMSPEQASGERDVDARTDIYSLACVTYEMLTGDPPYLGSTPAAILSKKLVEEAPSPRIVRDSLPGPAEAAIMKALAKVPADRYASASAFAQELTGESGRAAPHVLSALEVGKAALRRWLWPAAALLAVSAGIWLVRSRPPEGARTPATFVVPLPTEGALASNSGLAVAVSPDATRYVYAARTDRGTELYLRPIDQTRGIRVGGTEGAMFPFFSSDGESLGFVVDRTLMSVHLPTERLTRVTRLNGSFGGASWTARDSILFASGGAIYRVAAAGGEPDLIVSPGAGESSYWWPSELPDGAILFAVMTGMDLDATRIAAYRPATSEIRTLLNEGNYPKYAPTGHIVYGGAASSRGVTAIRAASFDQRSLELGMPVTMVDSAVYTDAGRVAQFDLAANGSLIYVAPRGVRGGDTLVWADRSGGAEVLDFVNPRSAMLFPTISSNGQQVGITTAGDSMQTWLVDLDRRTMSLFAPGARNSHFTIWSPSGDRVVFSSDRAGGALNLYVQRLDALGEPRRLTESPQHQDPASWSPDGQYVAYAEDDPETGWDIWLVDLTTDPPDARVLLRTAASEFSPMISPDGQWLAYVSTESGQREVYVQRFPGLGGQQQVSQDGGREPIWSPGSNELFYTKSEGATGDDSVWGVSFDFDADGGLTLRSPQLVLEEGPNSASGYGWPRYDVTRDARRFLIVRRGAVAPAALDFVVVLDWFTELRRRLPGP